LLGHGRLLAATGNEEEQPGCETSESDALEEHDRPSAYLLTNPAASLLAAATTPYSTPSAAVCNSSAFTFQFEKIKDVQAAERILTTELGPMLHVNVTWDAEKERYRQR
jgi:hypothetical protein